MAKTPQSLSLAIDKNLYDKKSNDNPSRLGKLNSGILNELIAARVRRSRNL